MIQSRPRNVENTPCEPDSASARCLQRLLRIFCNVVQKSAWIQRAAGVHLQGRLVCPAQRSHIIVEHVSPVRVDGMQGAARIMRWQVEMPEHVWH